MRSWRTVAIPLEKKMDHFMARIAQATNLFDLKTVLYSARQWKLAILFGGDKWLSAFLLSL